SSSYPNNWIPLAIFYSILAGISCLGVLLLAWTGFAAQYGRTSPQPTLPISQRLSPLLEKLIALMTTGKRPGSKTQAPLSHADAFVLIHAFVGVMRAMISVRG